MLFKKLEDLADQVEDLDINLEHLNNFVVYILRIFFGDFPEDMSTLLDLIVNGLDLPVNNRGAFPESISLEDLTDLLVQIRALNGHQNEINSLSSYISNHDYNDINPDWNIELEQARAFISMIAGNAEFDNLNIQVFYGHENHNNIIHNPQEGNFFA